MPRFRGKVVFDDRNSGRKKRVCKTGPQLLKDEKWTMFSLEGGVA